MNGFKLARAIILVILLIAIIIGLFALFNKKDTVPTVSEPETIANKKDEIAPLITLNGEKEITINLNDNYKDDGCKAEDNIDGDITSKVTITGEVDTKKEGEYTITYTSIFRHAKAPAKTRQ